MHEGRHRTFEKWLERVDLEALSWVPIVAALHEVFGPEHVEIVDFRLISRGQEAFISHLLTSVDPRLTFPVGPQPNKNRSVSARGLAMALEVNPHLKTGEERREFRRFVQTHFSNVQFPRPELLSAAGDRVFRPDAGAAVAALVRALGVDRVRLSLHVRRQDRLLEQVYLREVLVVRPRGREPPAVLDLPARSPRRFVRERRGDRPARRPATPTDPPMCQPRQAVARLNPVHGHRDLERRLRDALRGEADRASADPAALVLIRWRIARLDPARAASPTRSGSP